MWDRLLNVLPYVGGAVGAGLLGSVLGVLWAPKVHARSIIQHFAAGVVIAAVAISVMPEVRRLGTPPWILGGFALGGTAMVAMKWGVRRFERRRKKRGGRPVGLAATAAVDTTIDGIIIGTGFTTGHSLGVVLSLALAMELLFLTLSVSTEHRPAAARRRWAC